MIYKQIQKNLDQYKEKIHQLDVFDPAFAMSSEMMLKDLIEILKGLNWENVEELEAHKIKLILFTWLEELKQVSILIRDINLKTLIDLHRISDGKLDQDVFSIEINSSLNLLDVALDELGEKLAAIENKTNINYSLEDTWYHYNSPLDEYIDQLETILGQIKQIQEAKDNLFLIANSIKENKDRISKQLVNYSISVDGIIEKTKQVLGAIEVCKNLVDPKELTSLSNSLNQFNSELQNHHLHIMSSQDKISTLGKIKVPAYVSNGQLVVKELHVQNHINQWLEEEIFPTLLDINRLVELLYEKSILSTLNTKNRVELLKIDQQEGQIVPKSMLAVPLRKFLSEAELTKKDIQAHSEKLNSRINQDYLVSEIFSMDTLFLQDHVEFSLIDYSKNNNVFAQMDFAKYKKNLNNFAHKYLPEFNFHKSSKTDIITFIEHNKLPELDQFSQSLFLKKGFLGNSFNVSREEFKETLIQNYKHWQNGFRGSLLVYGNRLSGRSAIMESVEHILEDQIVINLEPNTEIKFKGRKHETELDLKSTLDFLYKHALTDKIVVVIDDIEIWRCKQIPFFTTVKNLLASHTKYNRRLFLIVSTNHHIKLQLDHFLDFSNYFLTKFNTDRMLKENIVKGLLIRHSASLREMSLDEEKQLLDEVALRRAAGNIARKSKFNIGVSLKNWSRFVIHSTSPDDEIEKPSTIFEDFIKAHSHILSHILRYKRTNEQELTEMVGSTYVRNISEDIQLMLSYQILQRNREGSISINDFIVQYIEETIKKEYLMPNKLKYV